MSPFCRLLLAGALVGAGVAAEDPKLDELVGADWNGRLRHETDLRQRFRAAENVAQRQAIVESLATAEHPAALGLALELGERSREPAVLQAALKHAPGRLAAAALLPDLRDMAQHRDAGVRAAAIRSLGSLDDDRAIPILIEQLGDPTVAAEAAEALEHITGLAHGTAPTAWSGWYDRQRREANVRVPEIASDLRSQDSDIVIKAMHRLLMLDQHTGLALELMEPLLLHTDPSVAAMAQQAFATIGGLRAEYILSHYEAERLAAARRRPGGSLASAAPMAPTPTSNAPTQENQAGSSGPFSLILVLMLLGGVYGWYRLSRAEPDAAGARARHQPGPAAAARRRRA